MYLYIIYHFIYIYIYYIYTYILYIYIYLYIYDSQIVHHNPCFNLFILHNNPFDNQGSKIKTTFFYVLTYCLLKIS